MEGAGLFDFSLDLNEIGIYEIPNLQPSSPQMKQKNGHN
jgi:hypothetical protein